MSKGTRAYLVRIPDDVMEIVQEEIALRNAHSAEEAWTLSEFVRVMILRGIRHRQRARRTGVYNTHLFKTNDCPLAYGDNG
jgi:hypothetical protein